MSCNCFPLLPSPDGSDCVLVLTTPASGSVSTVPVVKGSTVGEYGVVGTVFYGEITDLSLPIRLSGTSGVISTQNGTILSNTSFWVDSNGTILDITLGGPGHGESTPGYPPTFYGPQVFPGYDNSTSVWGNSSTKGRLNYTGVWPTTSAPYDPIGEWIGFTSEIDSNTTETYLIGIGSEDYFRVKLNGDLIIDMDPLNFVNVTSYTPLPLPSATWSVFPITLNSGKNFLELEGYSSNGRASFGAEIYTGNVATLSGITSQGVLSTYTVFSTAGLVGQQFTNAGISGQSCPSGYVLNTSSSPYYCVKVRRSPCRSSFTAATTTTTTQSYLNPGYIPVNSCDVFTVAPMIVKCNVANVSGGRTNANGSITLGITGGTTPYTITWQYPNGNNVQGPITIGNLSIGTYTATVTDYYGDFVVTTSCTVTGTTTTTTTTTTTLPPPEEYSFCMTITVTNIDGQIIDTIQFNFIPNGTMNGYPKWISSPSGQEIVYYNPSVPTNGGWSVSGSSTSVVTTNNIVLLNTNPSYPPITGINPNFTNWTVLYPSKAKAKVSANGGSCT